MKSSEKPKSVDVERDLIGVGAGPANLSLASLLMTARERGLTSITATFFECETTVFWHSLQMFPGSLMQTEFYRDLVTPIDPTNRFSFLNYLKAQRASTSSSAHRRSIRPDASSKTISGGLRDRSAR